MIPNMAHPDAPIGKDDKANLEVGRGKHSPREFDFKPLDHLELGEKHGYRNAQVTAIGTVTSSFCVSSAGKSISMKKSWKTRMPCSKDPS